MLDLLTMLGNILTIVISVGSLAYWLGRKFARIDERFKLIDERFKMVDERFSRIDERFKLIDERIDSIIRATTSQMEFFTEFLGFRKVIEERDVTFIVSQLHRISSVHLANPLTKEEAKRLDELLDKKELTLEEADELREIARRLVREHGHEDETVWKLLIYASIMRGIAMRKLGEKAEK
ncbi:MAG: hypothetical protein ACP5KE_09300 [Candidatus Methanodesulfokora sp.]|jgi:hypothetical protein|nr:MAG: hypothetical protein C0200_05605 [Candidatus Korarchaeota archaeon]